MDYYNNKYILFYKTIKNIIFSLEIKKEVYLDLFSLITY
jgi:hypothetical protein